MKLTSIEIHPDNSSNIIQLSFRDPKSINPYTVKNVTGLDGDTLNARTIAMQVGLNPSFLSYSTLRDNLYKTIASSRTGLVELRFLNGTTIVAAISGFVSKLESPQFAKSQEVTLTVTCPDPLIRAKDRKPESVLGAGLGALNIVDDDSTAPHGFIFQLQFLANESSLTINSPADPSWQFQIIPSGGFISSDVLFFSSEVGNKFLYVVRGSSTIQMADAITPGSEWPSMFPGRNIFGFTNPGSLQMTSFQHYLTYWGV